ncbi:MAG: amino acid permease [Fimbriimonadaceae bacterium]|nr:amino acid permease [Chitinophagales bacterium]
MQQQEEQHKLKQSLGFVDATMIVAGSMIGSGIFIVTADMARNLGGAGWILLLWLISGFITIIAALSYGELAGMMPKAGGQFIYIQKAYGNFVAFLYGWTVFAVIQTGVIAAVAVAFAKYTGVFFPSLGTDNILFTIGKINISAANIVAIILIILLSVINNYGVKNGKLIQLIFTSAKILALAALIICGLAVGLNSDTFAQNFQHAWTAQKTVFENGELTTTSLTGIALILALGTSIIGPLFSSDAWNNVTFIAGEIKDPKKNIPLSLLAGTLIVTALYILTNITYLALLPVQGDPNAADVIGQGISFADQDRVGTAAAYMILGNGAAYVMAALIMISTFGCNNGLILSGARVYYAMAKEGLFFKKAEKLNKYDVPGIAIIVQCIWACLLCLSGTYGDLLNYSTFASLLFYIVTIAGLFILRKKWKDVERPYKAFGYPLIPALYILIAFSICVILLITTPGYTGGGLVIVAVGIPFYFLTKKK